MLCLKSHLKGLTDRKKCAGPEKGFPPPLVLVVVFVIVGVGKFCVVVTFPFWFFTAHAHSMATAGIVFAHSFYLSLIYSFILPGGSDIGSRNLGCLKSPLKDLTNWSCGPGPKNPLVPTVFAVFHNHQKTLSYQRLYPLRIVIMASVRYSSTPNRLLEFKQLMANFILVVVSNSFCVSSLLFILVHAFEFQSLPFPN